ncbi:putative pyridoxal kinase C6F6.11c [Fusarium oxysporum f. sp. albedinis]|nr:putative pyridoxal kinase C6F6.11c [Fusarium oxysporum f. sp. albedinis]
MSDKIPYIVATGTGVTTPAEKPVFANEPRSDDHLIEAKKVKIRNARNKLNIYIETTITGMTAWINLGGSLMSLFSSPRPRKRTCRHEQECVSDASHIDGQRTERTNGKKGSLPLKPR